MDFWMSLAMNEFFYDEHAKGIESYAPKKK